MALLISACTPQPRSSACPTIPSPPVIDFGCQERGTITRIPLPGIEPGTFVGPGFQVTPYGLEFSPSELREYSDSFPIVRDGCVVAEQSVLGTGVDRVLRWSPVVVDFGAVRPGSTRRMQVTLEACALNPIELSNLATDEASRARPSFAFDAGSATIPRATRAFDGTLVRSALALEVSFTPTALGLREGLFVVSTTLPERPNAGVRLRGVGGGPVVGVMPTQLDFGAVSTPTSRVVTVTNTGTQADPPDLRAQLFLGLEGLPPYLELTPGNCGAVTLGTYDPNVGLSPGQSVSITVDLSPAPAPRTCTLRLFSTDPESPVTGVILTAR
jgi:hypothetical protein